jgi:hypothetical protein
MNPEIISKAIQNLAPGANFTFNHLDLDSLVFLNDVKKPTKAQIQSEIERVIEENKQTEANRVIAKAAAEAKLEALGLTPEDLKALGL